MLAKNLSFKTPLILVCAATLMLYAGTLRSLFEAWVSDGNYAHGALVLPVVMYMIYGKKDQLAQLPAAPSVAGNIMLAAGIGMLLVSQWADVSFLAGLSFVMVVAGLVWAFAGWWVMKALAFPLAFLIFMTPPPDIFVEKIGAPLQRLSCDFATALAMLANLGVDPHGVTFVSNGMKFSVDLPCSGIRAINALTAFTAVLAYFTAASNVKRFGFFLLAIPIAFFSNVLRVFFVILAANIYDLKEPVMRVHAISGPILFAIALSGMFLLKRRIECL